MGSQPWWLGSNQEKKSSTGERIAHSTSPRSLRNPTGATESASFATSARRSEVTEWRRRARRGVLFFCRGSMPSTFAEFGVFRVTIHPFRASLLSLELISPLSLTLNNHTGDTLPLLKNKSERWRGECRFSGGSVLLYSPDPGRPTRRRWLHCSSTKKLALSCELRPPFFHPKPRPGADFLHNWSPLDARKRGGKLAREKARDEFLGLSNSSSPVKSVTI